MKLYSLFALTIVTIASCSYDKEVLSTCNLTDTKYSTAVSKVMTDYCTGCHSGAAPSAGIDLNSFDSVKVYVNNGTLIGSIKHGAAYQPMPKGGPKLDDCTIARVQKWIDNGALNN
jgi:Cytochrome C oxidase, cbb3-type, subunit III